MNNQQKNNQLLELLEFFQELWNEINDPNDEAKTEAELRQLVIEKPEIYDKIKIKLAWTKRAVEQMEARFAIITLAETVITEPHSHESTPHTPVKAVQLPDWVAEAIEASETVALITEQEVEADTTLAANEEATQPQIDPQVASLLAQLTLAQSYSDWSKVIEIGQQLLELDGRNQSVGYWTAEAHTKRGMKAHNSGNYEQAIRDFSEAIELNPEVADYYKLRAVSHYAKNNYEQAIADFNHVINLTPSNPDYYYARGLALKRKGYHAAAEYDFVIAARLGHPKAQQEIQNLKL